MALKQPQQIFETIRRSRTPLILVSRGAGADGYASALGLSHVLKKIDKEAPVVAADGPAPQQISFLKGHDAIRHCLEQLRTFVIDVDTSKTRVDGVSHAHEENRLRFTLTPKQGFWNEADVRVSTTEYRYDLIIALGGSDLEAFGPFYEQNPDFFFRTPIINIDHCPANEHFGQINLVDLTASACGEVCHDLVHAYEPELFDEDIATAFLTGMIAKTKSFKTPNVTPKTLQTASRLMARGGRRDEIVSHLFRTRTVSTLRLWGRALARLKHEPKAKLVWTLLSQQDFMHAGAEERDLPDVIDELISSSPDAKLVLLLYEDGDRNVCGLLRAERPFDAVALAAPFNPAGTREEARMIFTGKSIVQVEKDLLPRLSESAAKTL